MTKNGDNGEEEINYVLATFTLDEAEYIARRMLDAVAFQRKLECPAGIPAGPEVVPFEEYIPSPEEKERLTLLNVLEKHNWDRDKAAHELGISARTLYRKIAQYGLKRSSKQPRLLLAYYLRIGSPQYCLRPQSLHRKPAQTKSNWFIAASTRAGLSVRMPASKLRVRVLFIPIPAPVRLAEPM